MDRRRQGLGQVSPDEYAAVIVAANYTSVRLRCSEREDITAGNAAEVARNVPAARFFRRAMQNKAIVKGAACHGLWLLTPSPVLLAGRKVICNKVVLADVINASGVYTPCVAGTPADKQVVVDGDLVTNNSWHATEAFVDAIKDAILAGPAAPSADPSPALPGPRGKRHILIAVSEWGYWGEELVGPLEEFEHAGYTVDFCTPNGRRPNAIPVSMDPDFFDPPLQRPVTSSEMAALVQQRRCRLRWSRAAQSRRVRDRARAPSRRSCRPMPSRCSSACNSGPDGLARCGSD